MGLAYLPRSAISPRSSWQTAQGGDACRESREPGFSRARWSKIGGMSGMMEAAAKPKSKDGSGPADSATGEHVIDPHAEHIHAQIGEFRKQLLGMTLRNNLLNCPHGPRVQAQVRVVDELPDIVFERIEAGGDFMFLSLPEPRDQPDDEDSDEFLEALARHKRESATYAAAIEQVSAQRDRTGGLVSIEREARDHVRLRLGMGEWESERGLSAEALCRRRGIDSGYELPSSSQEESAARHHDTALQTLFPEDDLSASLARLRDRARSSINQTGVATLFASFGFLEWFESDDSDQPHLAPLVLVPGDLDRQLVRGKVLIQISRHRRIGYRKCHPCRLPSPEFRFGTSEIRHGRFARELLREGQRRDLRASATLASPQISDNRFIRVFEASDIPGPRR